jgi:hypothetical protein
MSNLDEFTYKISEMGAPQKEYIATNHQVVYVSDLNGAGGYPSQQIQFDLTNMCSSDKFTAYSESFIIIPLTMTLQATDGHAFNLTNDCDYSMSLKNGIQHIIDSVQISINDQAVNNATSNSNIAMSWDLLKMGADNRKTFQDTILYGLDNPETIRYFPAATASPNGIGEVNNVIAPQASALGGGYYGAANTQNVGRLNRMQVTSFNVGNNSAGNPQAFYYESQQNLQNNNWISGVHLQNANTVQYYIYAVVPLALLHPVFKALPLCRGAKVKMTIFCNTGTLNAATNIASGCSVNLTTDGANYTGCTVNIPHATLPFMVSPIGANNGLSPHAVTTMTASLSLSNSNLVNCRVYLSQYELSPEYEAEYLKDPVKKVIYEDYTSYTIQNIASGQGVNQLVTNGLTKLRGFLMQPQLSYSANGGLGISPMASPFSSAPATCCPFAHLSNYQLQLAGRNLYDNPVNYSFEFFNENIRPTLSLNGGSFQSLGMSSGSISNSDWSKGYGYIYSILDRHANDAIDSLSRSVQVVFTNSSAVAMDYVIIVFYEREFTINCSTGLFVNQ